MVNTKNCQSVFPVTRATGPERFLLRKFASKSTTHANATLPFLPASQQISLVLCVLVFICWLLPGLSGHEPWKPDEAYTFGLIRHIAQTGDWVVPTLAGEPFMEKPPLYFVVASFFLRLFSPLLGEPDAARMATGFFIVIACYAIALSARELFGKGAGRWAVLILFACIGFPVRAHQMITDTALFAGGAIGIYGFILGIRRHVLGGVILGIGAAVMFLSKGLLGPGILGLTALTLPLMNTAFRSRRYIVFCAIAFLVFCPLVVPWLYALWMRSEKLFSTWLLVNNFGRFDGTAKLGPKAKHFFYVKLLPWYAFPALPMAAWWLWRSWKTGISASAMVLVTFFLAGFVTLSSASDARELYAMPLLLPLVILAAGACQQKTLWTIKLRPWALGLFCLLPTVMWGAGIILMTGWPAPLWNKWVAQGAPGFTPQISSVMFAAASLATLLLSGLVFLNRTCRESPLSIFTSCITLCWVLAMTLGMPYLDYTKRYSDVFLPLRAWLPKDECVASRHLGEPQRALLEYYDGLITLREEKHRGAYRCNWLLVQHDKRHPEEFVDGTLVWQGERPADNEENYQLYRLNR